MYLEFGTSSASRLPTELRQLIDAYMLTTMAMNYGAIPEYTSSIYWEGRHDASEDEWNQVIQEAPHLAQYCPHCPLKPLLNAYHSEWAFRTLTDRRWPREELQPGLMEAAAQGNVAIIQQLRQHHHCDKTDAIGGLAIASMYGHVSVLREFRTNWYMTDDYELVAAASRNGHVSVLEEFRTNWGMTTNSAREDNNAALRRAAEHGHVAVLQELRINWGLTTNDARSLVNYPLEIAVRNNHLHVVREFRLNWGLTQNDVQILHLDGIEDERMVAELALFT